MFTDVGLEVEALSDSAPEAADWVQRLAGFIAPPT